MFDIDLSYYSPPRTTSTDMPERPNPNRKRIINTENVKPILFPNLENYINSCNEKPSDNGSTKIQNKKGISLFGGSRKKKLELNDSLPKNERSENLLELARNPLESMRLDSTCTSMKKKRRENSLTE